MLIPTLQPALAQVLLPFNTYHTTGSSTIVDDLHKLEHEISHAETSFIEDKWAQWSSSQSTIIPSNIHKGISTTHVVENIDWKNKISTLQKLITQTQSSSKIVLMINSFTKCSCGAQL